MLSTRLLAQPCNSSSASFINQEDIANWLIQNPNCDKITKDVVVGEDVENLDELERIKKIGGYLAISNCKNIPDTPANEYYYRALQILKL